MDDEAWVTCPFCFEAQVLVVDPGTRGQFVQDCDVCCHPWTVHVSRDDDGNLSVDVSRGNE